MLKFVLALVFIAAGGALAWLTLTQENFCLVCEFRSDSSSLNKNPMQLALIDDLRQAAKEKELPEIWGQIMEVRYLYHSKKVQGLLEKSPIVAVNKKGTKSLLVEFFDEPGSPDIVMVRYNVTDIATGNTVSEINRRMKLPVTKTVTPKK